MAFLGSLMWNTENHKPLRSDTSSCRMKTYHNRKLNTLVLWLALVISENGRNINETKVTVGSNALNVPQDLI